MKASIVAKQDIFRSLSVHLPGLPLALSQSLPVLLADLARLTRSLPGENVRVAPGSLNNFRAVLRSAGFVIGGRAAAV